VDRFPLVIVGSGPGGLAAAAQAASVGLDYVLLERSARLADTIENFAKGKLVMNTPKRLPLHPGLPLSFTEGPVDRVLATWRRELEAKKVLRRVRFNSDVTGMVREDGRFRVTLAAGDAVEGDNVVLAMGTQGNITKLAVPGAERVRYQLDDPGTYRNQHIVVVGSGDTAIENAIALAERNRVTLVVRGRAFKPEKVTVANLAAIESALRAGTIECRWDAQTVRVEPDRIVLKVAGSEEALACDHVIARIGSLKPRKFLESCGVRFDSDDENADPVIDERYRSDVEGLYVVGALAGYPLIKHCLNQGYEVVEHIRGARVVPADRPALDETLADIAGRSSVEQVLKRIAAAVPLFSGVSRLTLGDVLLDSRVVMKAAGEPIIRRNEYGDSIFAIFAGTVAVEINPGDQSQDRTLGTGDFFGEMGLISGRPRSATVRAASDCTLIEVPRRAALKLFNAVPAAKTRMDEALIVRQLRAYVSEDLAGSDLAELAAAARQVSFAFGDTMLETGTAAKDVYLIQSGSAKVSCQSWGRELVLRYLPAGHIVGDYAHLADHPPSVTVTAAAKTVAMRIDGEVFARIVAGNAALKSHLTAQMEQQLRENVSTMEKSRASAGVFSDFLANGVGEATNILVIDEALCTRCDNCERACADTHGGISRLNREAGPTYASLHVPTSCRHCQHPACMRDCPTDAIHRALNGEVYIDQSCIGCGACEKNCPYGVIHMAAEPAQKPNLLFWLLFGWGAGPGEDRSHQGVAKRTGPKHAVKCDMCQGIGSGPACVSACPTGAAMRVDPNQLLDLTRAVRA
jgi:thioredoxin reductase/CRP-like cAMP-binding protein/Fe-S-cluster-containing hydrogenase component 2